MKKILFLIFITLVSINILTAQNKFAITPTTEEFLTNTNRVADQATLGNQYLIEEIDNQFLSQEIDPHQPIIAISHSIRVVKKQNASVYTYTPSIVNRVFITLSIDLSFKNKKIKESQYTEELSLLTDTPYPGMNHEPSDISNVYGNRLVLNTSQSHPSISKSNDHLYLH